MKKIITLASIAISLVSCEIEYTNYKVVKICGGGEPCRETNYDINLRSGRYNADTVTFVLDDNIFTAIKIK